MDLSIIIPVFNESTKICADIQSASSFLHEHQLHGEIIIADDGSTDGTCELAKDTPVDKQVKLHVLETAIHKGKGFALR
ncbi:MAG: glycosyltransferase, partial [Calditrichaeota bacterium]